ncbi:MAG: AAA family ATPase, partial [Candidatus Hadarchaeales archaeon]
MIERLIIKNFKSIEELDIKLGQVNAFIGPNNAGKSNIMDALNLILGETYPTHAFDDKDFHNYDKSRAIEIEVKFDQPLVADSRVWGFHLSYDGDTCEYIALDQNGDRLTWTDKWRRTREVHVSNAMKDEVLLMYLGLDRQAHQQIKPTRWTVYGKLLMYIEKTIGADKKEKFKSDVENTYRNNIFPYLEKTVID